MPKSLMLALCLSWTLAAACMAEEAPLGLYQTRAVTSGTMPDRRALGFALCFRDVVVKVSGDPRLAGHPAVDALSLKAQDTIIDFSFRDRLSGKPLHDEQGSYDRPHDLTCSFDPSKIDGVLADLGRKPWPLPRPHLVLVLAIRDMNGVRSLLASDAADRRGIDMGLSARQSAERLGLTLRLPAAQEISDAGILVGTDGPPVRLGDAIVLSGRLDWSDAARGWVARWRIVNEGTSAEWSISGVSFDDAFRNGLGGAAQILSRNGTPR